METAPITKRQKHWITFANSVFIVLRKFKLIRRKTTPESIELYREELLKLIDNRTYSWDENSIGKKLMEDYVSDIMSGFIQPDPIVTERTSILLSQKRKEK